MTLTSENTNFSFDSVAGRYDLCNHLFSMGLDRRWRRAFVRALAPRQGDKVLDLCSGTGDVVFSFLKHSPARDLTAVDLSEPMMHLAQEKQILYASAKWMHNAEIKWLAADISAVPLESNIYDIVTCAFGIRNVTNRLAALSEIRRLLKPSGRLGVLEFSLPSDPFLRLVYLFYLKSFMPAVGKILFGKQKPLAYLASSIEYWDSQVDVAQELTETEFVNVSRVPLTFGTVTLWSAQKPG